MFLGFEKRVGSRYKRPRGNIAHPSNNNNKADQSSLIKTNSEYLDNMVEYISCLRRVSSCSPFIIFYIFSYFIDHRCFDNLE